MNTQSLHPDIVAARVIGIGVGLIALMLTWLVSNRLLGVFIEAPTGPIVAFSAATVIGLIAALVAGRRLAAAAKRDLRRDN